MNIVLPYPFTFMDGIEVMVAGFIDLQFDIVIIKIKIAIIFFMLSRMLIVFS